MNMLRKNISIPVIIISTIFLSTTPALSQFTFLEEVYPLASDQYTPICYLITEQGVTVDLMPMCGFRTVPKKKQEDKKNTELLLPTISSESLTEDADVLIYDNNNLPPKPPY